MGEQRACDDQECLHAGGELIAGCLPRSRLVRPLRVSTRRVNHYSQKQTALEVGFGHTLARRRDPPRSLNIQYRRGMPFPRRNGRRPIGVTGRSFQGNSLALTGRGGQKPLFSQSRSMANSDELRSVALSLAVPASPSRLRRNQSRPELPVRTSAELSSRTVRPGPSDQR